MHQSGEIEVVCYPEMKTGVNGNKKEVRQTGAHVSSSGP